jgi:hypothetical protein
MLNLQQTTVVLEEAFVPCLPVPMHMPAPRLATSNLRPLLLQVEFLERKKNVLHQLLIMLVL